MKFGMLTVIGPETRIKRGSRTDRALPCICDCGKERVVPVSKLVSGHTRSCGCLQRSKAREAGKANLLRWSGSYEGKNQAAALGRVTGGRNKTHGLSRHPLYGTWYQMINRCENSGYPRYRDWGGRGITVCERWHDVRLFIEDIERTIGPRPPGKTLDRKDNYGPYGPGKVRWATPKEQQANSRRYHRQTH